MRPVDKGDVPLIEGKIKIVSDYKDWRQDLIDRIGNSCAYCNMNLNDSPQVEHVSPKSSYPNLALSWDNMLLACGPCNRAKSDSSYSQQLHYQPDYHNTHLAFDYIVVNHPLKPKTLACVPIPADNPYVNKEKARRTIDLLKLDAIVSNPRATDLRWKYRYEAYVSAQLWRESWNNFGKDYPEEFIPLLLDNIKGKGFFSIWHKVFVDISDVCMRLLQVFDGTLTEAFNHNGAPIPLHSDDL